MNGHTRAPQWEEHNVYVCHNATKEKHDISPPSENNHYETHKPKEYEDPEYQWKRYDKQ